MRATSLLALDLGYLVLPSLNKGIIIIIIIIIVIIIIIIIIIVIVIIIIIIIIIFAEFSKMAVHEFITSQTTG